MVYSHYFHATKRIGGFCPILNLKMSNLCLLVKRFRMEILVSILQDFLPGMWLI